MSRRIAAGLALILPLANLEAAQPSSPVPKAPPALVKAQMDAARKAFELYLKRQQDRAGEPGPEKLYVWSRRWMEAQQALASEKDRRVQAAQDHLDRMKAVERTFTALASTGLGLEADRSAAESFRLEAEIWLAQAKVR